MLHVIIQPPFDEFLTDLVNAELLDSAQRDDNKPKCAHFEIGQSTEAAPVELVTSVWADGPELRHIFTYFSGLPVRFIENDLRTLAEKQKWFGDDAKFIVANWI